MKRKEEESPKIYISAEELKELQEKYPNVFNQLVQHRNENKRKRKKTKVYISTDDIEELHTRYAPIFKQLCMDSDCGLTYIESMYDTTLNTLMREIEELSEENRLDIEVKKARINATNDEQIPKYTRPISRLFFRTPNRAMAAILDEAAIEANEQHSKKEHTNEVGALESARALAYLSSSEKLPRNKKGKLLSRRKLNKLRIKYENLSTLLEDSQLPNGKKLSRCKLKKLRKRYERLSAIFAPPDVVNELGEESELTNVANDQGEAYQMITYEEVVEQVADNPGINTTLPKRRKRKPKPAEQTETPYKEQSEQLPGQMNIEEINAEDGENKET